MPVGVSVGLGAFVVLVWPWLCGCVDYLWGCMHVTAHRKLMLCGGEYVRVNVGMRTGRCVHGLNGDEPHCLPLAGPILWC